MTVAIVLINVEPEKTNRIAEELSSIPGLSEVYSVAGNYDLIAIVRVKDSEELAGLVTSKVRGVGGITRTETLIAFQAYSQHDLNSLFGMN